SSAMRCSASTTTHSAATPPFEKGGRGGFHFLVRVLASATPARYGGPMGSDLENRRMSGGLDAGRPSIGKLRGYVPGEQPQDQRYIKLNTNENPYPPSPQVLAAVTASATADLRLYPDPMADNLRDAAAAEYGFQRNEILAGNGSDDLLAII